MDGRRTKISVNEEDVLLNGAILRIFFAASRGGKGGGNVDTAIYFKLPETMPTTNCWRKRRRERGEEFAILILDEQQAVVRRRWNWRWRTAVLSINPQTVSEPVATARQARIANSSGIFLYMRRLAYHQTATFIEF